MRSFSRETKNKMGRNVDHPPLLSIRRVQLLQLNTKISDQWTVTTRPYECQPNFDEDHASKNTVHNKQQYNCSANHGKSNMGRAPVSLPAEAQGVASQRAYLGLEELLDGGEPPEPLPFVAEEAFFVHQQGVLENDRQR